MKEGSSDPKLCFVISPIGNLVLTIAKYGSRNRRLGPPQGWRCLMRAFGVFHVVGLAARMGLIIYNISQRAPPTEVIVRLFDGFSELHRPPKAVRKAGLLLWRYAVVFAACY